MRKKVDSRIRTLVENCVKLRQRSLFVIIGDKGRDQVVNLHYMLSKATVKARPSVLWCYKKDLHLSSHKKKRMKQIKKLAQRGLLDTEKEDPFALFVASTQIRYCYYHETQNILGNTYGMAVLQDFEALTPNLLARTVETVEGGGMIILLLSNLSSLTQLYSLTMDVHSRLRTESHQDVTGRFNERLVLSLASCPNCLMMDDELNVLPTSSLIKEIQPVPLGPDGTPLVDPSREAAAELKELADSLTDTQPAGSLVGKCRTLDQARAVVTFLDAASEKTLRSTVALTASRGRGKSAALGLAIAGALALGYANIFVTAPSPENLKTLFSFIFKGLDSLGYKEHLDYDLVESTNPAFGKAIVRVNVFRAHRQTVQYILPQHHAKLAQAELLVIDEAAAIPLTTVKSLLGPYLVFLCSTVNGYEGTGRSLSLKLIQQLREQGAKLASGGGSGAEAGGPGAAMRTFREVTLAEPIRYAPGDHIESWLHELLCLDATTHMPKPPPKLPHPSSCDLYYVERDTLFSYHKASERFLQQMVSLYVASHYKNTPNDLLLMADAPAHHLFVLLGPVDETQNVMPDILAVVQVALEGAISRKSAVSGLARGELPQGDLIPWTLSQQYQDPDLPSLSGARVVRIAVHPDVPRAGYGSRCVELLKRYYQGQLSGVLDDDEVDGSDDEEQMNDRKASHASAGPSSAAVNGSLSSKKGGKQQQQQQQDGKGGSGKKRQRLEEDDDEDGSSEEEGSEEDDEGGTEDGDGGAGGKGPKRTKVKLGSAGGAGSSDRGHLLSEKVVPRTGLPPLLVNLGDRPPERLHYLGVSYGLTQQLFNFWRKNGFEPLYLRQSASETTGEHTAIMLAPLEHPDVAGGHKWVDAFVRDFKNRFLSLLSGAFRGMSAPLALSILDPRLSYSDAESQAAVQQGITVTRLDGGTFTPYDLKRLQAYSNNLVDYHLILDLLPPLTATYFSGRLPATLSYAQAAILLMLGLQHRGLEDCESELSLPSNQVLALFSKAVRKLYGHLKASKEAALERTLPKASAAEAIAARLAPQGDDPGLDEELDQAAAAVRASLKETYLAPDALAQFAVAGADEDLAAATGGKVPASGGLVSVRSTGKAAAASGTGAGQQGGKGKDGKKDGGLMYARKDKHKGGGGKKHGGGGGKKPKH